jgi:hypothetical protein
LTTKAKERKRKANEKQQNIIDALKDHGVKVYGDVDLLVILFMTKNSDNIF